MRQRLLKLDRIKAGRSPAQQSIGRWFYRRLLETIVGALCKRAIRYIHTFIFLQQQKILHKNTFYATFPPLKYDITS